MLALFFRPIGATVGTFAFVFFSLSPGAATGIHPTTKPENAVSLLENRSMIAFPKRNGGSGVGIIGETIDRRAARRPGQLSVHSHGWELFSSDTSSYAHAHPIDFINPDCHLLGGNISAA